MQKIKQYTSLVTRASDYSDCKIQHITELIAQMSENFERSELLLIQENGYDFADDIYAMVQSNFAQNEQFNNVSVKYLHSEKNVKDYALPNIGLQTSVGDVIIYARRPIDFLELNFHNIQDALSSHAHIAYLIDQDADNRFRTSNAADMYQSINKEYHSEMVPDNAFGFAVTRQAMNTAFAIQSQTYDPFIALGVSGANAIKIPCLRHADNSAFKQTSYSQPEKLELLIHYTRYGGLKALYAPAFLAIAAIMILAMLSFFYIHLTKFGLMISAIFGPPLLILPMVYANHVSTKQAVAAGQNRNLVGQFSVRILL